MRIDNRSDLHTLVGAEPNCSDNELLLQLYDKFGRGSANHLLGDFAFAIWDPKDRIIYAARDIMGCQPVYYSTNARGFFIAESIEQLYACEHVNDSEDEGFIIACVSGGFAHHERTAFSEIRKVAPAHWLEADANGTRLEAYWRPQQVQKRRWDSHEACLEEFRTLLRQAVADRLPAKGGVGVHVSGGLDCSSIALLASEHLRDQGEPGPQAFTWYPKPGQAMGEAEQEEYERLNAVFAAMDTVPVYTQQSIENILEVLDRDNRIQPMCNASFDERPVLNEAKKRDVTMILSGLGGDEAASFDGRGYLEGLALGLRWRELASFAASERRSPARLIIQKLFYGAMHKSAPDGLLRAFFHQTFEEGRRGLGALIHGLIAVISSRLGRHKTINDSELRPYLLARWQDVQKDAPRLDVVRYWGVKQTIGALLTWPHLINRIESVHLDAAKFGVTMAYPLLDRRVIEFALSLPEHAFRDSRWNRLFYREAMAPILPDEVCWRHVKNDPARANELFDAMSEAITAKMREIRGAGKGLPETKYLDLNRFVSDLSETDLKGRARKGRVLSAIVWLQYELQRSIRSEN